MTSNLRSQLSSTSLQHQFTTQRQWRKFLMNQVLTMCLTVDTMHSRNFSKYIYMNRSLLCEPRRICNANAVNGGAGCQRIYWQMLRLNSLNTIHSGSIQRDSYDEEQDREFAFLTNAFHLTAPEIANLYKNRWQIEHFFYDKYIVMRSAIIPPVKNRLISWDLSRPLIINNSHNIIL